MRMLFVALLLQPGALAQRTYSIGLTIKPGDVWQPRTPTPTPNGTLAGSPNCYGSWALQLGSKSVAMGCNFEGCIAGSDDTLSCDEKQTCPKARQQNFNVASLMAAPTGIYNFKLQLYGCQVHVDSSAVSVNHSLRIPPHRCSSCSTYRTCATTATR